MRKMLGQREKKRPKEESEERKEGGKERCRRGKSDEKMCKPLEMSFLYFPPQVTGSRLIYYLFHFAQRLPLDLNLTLECAHYCLGLSSDSQGGGFCCPQES